MMQPYCYYVFDSQLANEAAQAVEDGQCGSIIEYHYCKYPQTKTTNNNGNSNYTQSAQQFSSNSISLQYQQPQHQTTPPLMMRPSVSQPISPQNYMQPLHSTLQQPNLNSTQQQTYEPPVQVQPPPLDGNNFNSLFRLNQLAQLNLPNTQLPSPSLTPPIRTINNSTPNQQISNLQIPVHHGKNLIQPALNIQIISPPPQKPSQKNRQPLQPPPQKQPALSPMQQISPQHQNSSMTQIPNNQNFSSRQQSSPLQQHYHHHHQQPQLPQPLSLASQQLRRTPPSPQQQKHFNPRQQISPQQQLSLSKAQPSPNQQQQQQPFLRQQESPQLHSTVQSPPSQTSSTPDQESHSPQQPIKTLKQQRHEETTKTDHGVNTDSHSPPKKSNSPSAQQALLSVVHLSPDKKSPQDQVSRQEQSPQENRSSQNNSLSPQTKSAAVTPDSQQQKMSITPSPSQVQPSPKHAKQQISPDSVVKTNSSIKNKTSRRRSSERRETLKEGLMRTMDFVVALKDLKHEHPSLWRITGNNLLQQFEPREQDNNTVLYENTNQYAGWNPDIKKEYIGVDCLVTQQSRNQITVERLYLNFEKMDDSDSFYDKHFAVFLQILVSTVLDPKFWEGLREEPDHYAYFMTSRKIFEDITMRYKKKLSSKWKLDKLAIKKIETYPNLVPNSLSKVEQEKSCRACNTNLSTESIAFGSKTYDLNTLESVKITEESSHTDKNDQKILVCNSCKDKVVTYSNLHHMRWRLFNQVKKKIANLRSKGMSFKDMLDDCFKDEEWLSSIYMERDALWSKIENIE